MSATWAAVLVASAGCYLLKLAGLLVPRTLLEREPARRLVELLPVTLLAALVALQTLATGQHLGIDARAGGVGVAAVLLVLRAPFLAVIAGAALTTALLRLHG